WIDLDDEIVGAEKIAGELEYMVKNNLDVIWFRYDYIPRETLSDPESLSWRERIVKNAPNLEWRDVAVHETLDESIQGEINEELRSEIIIKHRKTLDGFLKSNDRNQRILEKDWAAAPTAVTGYYLGRTLAGLGEYEDAIDKLVFAAEKSEIIPVQFESWLNLCDCYFALTKYDKALDAANKAMTIDPDHPMPWFKKFMVYQAQGMHTAAMHCAEMSLEKPVEGGRGLVLTVDLSWYQYKAPFEIARAYLAMGKNDRAYDLYKKVKDRAPQYIEELGTKMNISWDDMFEVAYNNIHEQ
ncbi:tetratricopeptide repeat protein, partial [Candidatus Saccharibacteria bacterium]|nr:tetratricopeptide repeat protein [Candidatus Saccharibacteria bacterium]